MTARNRQANRRIAPSATTGTGTDNDFDESGWGWHDGQYASQSWEKGDGTGRIQSGQRHDIDIGEGADTAQQKGVVISLR